MLSFVLGILILMLVGIPTYLIASKKGYKSLGTKIMCFTPILNFLGIVIYLGLPDLINHRLIDSLQKQLELTKSPKNKINIINSEVPKKQCIHCNNLSPVIANYCEQCGNLV